MAKSLIIKEINLQREKGNHKVTSGLCLNRITTMSMCIYSQTFVNNSEIVFFFFLSFLNVEFFFILFYF